MFTVEKDTIGRYHISIGTGKMYSAIDLDEVKIALDHYWDNKACWLGDNPKCPLCRDINEEREKKGKC